MNVGPTDHDAAWLKEYTDMRHAGLVRLGTVALASVAACVWIAFTLNGKAVKLAFDGNAREVEGHNGTIRRWEIDWTMTVARLATKEEIAPLLKDYNERHGSAVTAGKFWSAITVVGMAGIGLGGIVATVLIKVLA